MNKINYYMSITTADFGEEYTDYIEADSIEAIRDEINEYIEDVGINCIMDIDIDKEIDGQIVANKHYNDYGATKLLPLKEWIKVLDL